jgi:hypothetical protein
MQNMPRRPRLVLLMLALCVGWLAAAWTPTASTHVETSATAAAPCGMAHAGMPCSDDSTPTPGHAGMPGCATATGCPVLTALAPAPAPLTTRSPRAQPRPPRLALPDGIVPPPDRRPPRRA